MLSWSSNKKESNVESNGSTMVLAASVIVSTSLIDAAFIKLTSDNDKSQISTCMISYNKKYSIQNGTCHIIQYIHVLKTLVTSIFI